MNPDEMTAVRQAITAGESPPIATLSTLANPDAAVAFAIERPAGRRWLRGLDDLSPELAGRLLEFEEDFRSSRRDASLQRVVRTASHIDLLRHSWAVAAGSAAAVLWERLAGDPDEIVRLAIDIISSSDAAAAESTLYLLALDPIDPYSVGADRRSSIARAGLHSDTISTRTLAAEYLFDHNLEILAAETEILVLDVDERVRGLAWSAGFRLDPADTFELATRILGDETEVMPARRSALAAIGTHLPTGDLVEILSYFVVHPEEQLALDAANLHYRLHRHPTIATAAVGSPHLSVREIGAFLLDPYRGSPAAGGSRPGDPTRSDIFAELIRQTEERLVIDDSDSSEEDP